MTTLNIEKFVSTTELKNNTKNILASANKLGEIFIMNNNKPSVVIMSISEYNNFNKYNIPEIEPDENEKKLIEKYENDKKNWNIELIWEEEVFNLLNELK